MPTDFFFFFFFFFGNEKHDTHIHPPRAPKSAHAMASLLPAGWAAAAAAAKHIKQRAGTRGGVFASRPSSRAVSVKAKAIYDSKEQGGEEEGDQAFSAWFRSPREQEEQHNEAAATPAITSTGQHIPRIIACTSAAAARRMMVGFTS
jgi:hypothetical protein